MDHFIVSQVSRHGYLAILVLMALGSACIPIPSEVIMLFGGALAAGVAISGVTGHLNVLDVALIGTLGSLIGSWIAYGIGRTGGRALAERYGKYVLLRKHDIDRAEVFFAKRGTGAVFFGRMIPVIRTFISFPAGVAEMPVLKFSLLTFLGSLPWTFGLAYAGKSLANNWETVSRWGTPISLIILVIIVFVIGRWVMSRRQTSSSAA